MIKAIGAFLTFSFLSSLALGQLPDDALRYGYPIMSGTARNMAIGGAMGSLGGDISAAHINPAGIGFYKNKEMVISPQFSNQNNKYYYLGTASQQAKSGLGLGTSGFVIGRNDYNTTKNSQAFSITINRLANYNEVVEYKGLNNLSSWSEQYLEELTNNQVTSADRASNDFIFGSSLAYWTYLIDSISDPNGNIIGYTSLVPVGQGGAGTSGVNQHNTIRRSGSANELALSYGRNRGDKFYYGLSLGIPIYRFNKSQNYRETDASDNTDNDFSYFEYQEYYTTRGVGFNAKLGIIYKPIEKLRLGLALHTPTFAGLSDRISSSITTNTENYSGEPQPITKTSEELKGNSTAGEYQYALVTPTRFLGSVSYVINEVADIKKQKGFLTADIEWVNNKGVRYQAQDGTNGFDVSYYEGLNNIIKSRFKNTFNLRVGGELKFNTIMVRTGFAYLSNPYANSNFTGRRMLLSGGLGYRNRGVSVDLAYVHGLIKNSDVPYYLADKSNVIADAKNRMNMVTLSLGFKFL